MNRYEKDWFRVVPWWRDWPLILSAIGFVVLGTISVLAFQGKLFP